jgi:DNA polymerase-3 subunit alpha
MRRLGVACLAPDVNASEADFSVEAVPTDGEPTFGVRYALAALKGVGERAMEELVAERNANGAFTSLGDIARRVDPRLLNKRQLETLGAAGAFDSLDTNRPGIVAIAETILATAARLHDQRTSGQGGLFGESDGSDAVLKPLATARWTLAERMEQEKEAFGFYFSAHPVDRHRLLAQMHGARTYASLGDLPIAEGQRTGATMAALVEDARWRTSARGRRYLMATLSDATGQFIATCFDDMVAAELEEAGKAGGCGLLTVELDRRPGEETPRVTVKRIQPFETLATSARVAIELRIAEPTVLADVARLVAGARGGRGELRLRAPLPEGGEAVVLLGRDFLLDAELAAQLEVIPGIGSVAFTMSETRLALVS